ncbi:MAG: hypothetical protein K2X03_12510 [Bryobacteraceae bacterium]|nr:hypothetical protein [Bryobacteraceae bacterium]
MVLALLALTLGAHPMGNFSVNRYARLDLDPQGGSSLTYVLDFAEIPTFELFQQWKLDEPNSAQVQAQAQRSAADWVAQLALTQDGQRVAPRLRHVKSQMVDGAGGMPVLRVEMASDLALSPGDLRYADRNFAGRAGWKEIVVRRGNGVAIAQTTHSGRDLSRALTAYPEDLTLAPPQDLEAHVVWSAPGAGIAAREKPVASQPIQEKLPDFKPPAPAAGTVVRGDYLSRLLKHQEMSTSMILLGLLAAFGLGAMHALSPGHGKTIVAAYLVGSRGTLRHALFLGGMVTFTHTLSVFALGLGVLFFQQYVVPEQIIPWLGAASGISIVAIGTYLLYRRSLQLSGHEHEHVHVHEPEPELVAVAGQPSFLSRVNPEAPVRFAHTHTHDGSTHSHDLPDEITLKSLMVLGASGGLVPCPSALVLMLSAIALGRTALGLGLLVSFSAGLALVLMAIGGLVIYAKHLLPERTSQHPVFRLVPVFSAVAVMILGILMTLTSLGWIKTPYLT